jgi:hypothetical protein
LKNHWVRKASPNSNSGSNSWWKKTTTLGNIEKETLLKSEAFPNDVIDRA